MGCDIHGPWLETCGPHGWWQGFAEFDLPRDYALFARLAGVRSWEGYPKMFDAKGFPPDVHLPIRYEFEGPPSVVAHTPSWLDLSEARQAAGDSIGMQAVVAAMEALEKQEGIRTRIVFWFDN